MLANKIHKIFGGLVPFISRSYPHIISLWPFCQVSVPHGIMLIDWTSYRLFFTDVAIL